MRYNHHILTTVKSTYSKGDKMTTTTLPPHGAKYGDGPRKALIVIRDNVEWIEIYQIELCPTGQWYRNSKVSVPITQSNMPADVLEWLPKFDQAEIPDDFWLPQGKIRSQMYGKYAPNFNHMALVVTRRVNFEKAKAYARQIGAWDIEDYKYGVIAEFPGQEMPWFFTWEQFKITMDTHFPVK